MTLIKYNHRENENKFVIVDAEKRTFIESNLNSFNFDDLNFINDSDDFFSSYIRKHKIWEIEFETKDELINKIPEEFL